MSGRENAPDISALGGLILQAALPTKPRLMLLKAQRAGVVLAGLLDAPILDWLFSAFQRPGWEPDGPVIEGVVWANAHIADTIAGMARSTLSAGERAL